MVEGKRRKHHDKDKYYRLAKEQGFRSRAAFKLSQINRKFHLLENARVVLDLCAAPGGWTQVAHKTISKKGALIVAVDILPIRSLPNVITLVGDITTHQCLAEIKRELQGAAVDVVLHDGAPNVGAAFEKDAYEQNEIALHALKCATQHLKPHGSFVTKLYRSRDYASYVWVAKQLFREVQAVKPTASRSQSAEIFLVCQNYIAPTKLDPRMLDPKSVFEQVEGDSTGGGNNASSKKYNVFHKSWDIAKRQRGGYDMEHLDATMRHVEPVVNFVGISANSHSHKDPIAMLGTCTGMAFACEECNTTTDGNCHCQFLLNHSQTTREIKACLADLKVLNKSDFKGLLTWRTKMQDALKEMKHKQQVEQDDDDDDSSQDQVDTKIDSDKEEDEIQAEIAEMRRRRAREKKKVKKKERAVAAKRRKRAALGMDLNAIDVPDNEKIFSLATITTKGELEAAREVDLGTVTDKQLLVGSDNEEDEESQSNEQHDEEEGENEETGYSYRLDGELDDAYDLYLKTTKDGMAKSGTKMAKRSKKLQRQKALEQANEDAEMMMADEKGINQDTRTYAKMLQGNQDDDSEEEEEDNDDDGFDAKPVTPKEHAALKRKMASKKAVPRSEPNPLIYKLPDDPSSVKTARWFSNPLFESIGNTAQLASMAVSNKEASNQDDFDSSDEEEEEKILSINSGDDSASEDDSNTATLTKRGMNADDVLAMMPKTDKQIRHVRRLKALERGERKKARRAKRAGQEDKEFELAPADDNDEILNPDEKLEGLSEAQKKKMLEAQALIKAGMGEAVEDGGTNNSRFEVVSAGASNSIGSSLPIMDNRKYDSENEDYDSDDYAQTLALGTMMLRRSKAKALVDASYNRYAWNDPSDLPEWFVDDENKHYRPQLPIPPALLQKMKDKVLHLSTKPIAKVAEARARKHKRARTKLVAAKKKAEVVAHSSEMSEAMKLKAISKAMRVQDAARPGKAYAVSKKGRGTKGAKGVKQVDKRMKSDKRGMDRAEKKRKGGRTGGKPKRRRH